MKTYEYWREMIMLASDEPDLSPEEEYKYYLKNALRTKDDLLQAIKRGKQAFAEPQKGKSEHSDSFYARMADLFDKFYLVVDNKLLPEPLDNWWAYTVTVRETGLTLMLNHMLLIYEDNARGDDRYLVSSDEWYELAEKKAELLTLEQYGGMHGVESGTVRQWIRRGKLKSASKFGNDWRVPELADKPKRGSANGHYEWHTDLPDPPEGIPEINEYDSLYLYQSRKNGEWHAKLECMDKDSEIREYALNPKTKEKLELYLISHPLVECINNYYGEIRQKRTYEKE